jgi:hypothetical protein
MLSGKRAVPLAPYAVVAHVHAVVAHKDEQCIVPNAAPLQRIHDLADARIHRGDGRIITAQQLLALLALPLRARLLLVRMRRKLGHRIERAVVVKRDVRLRMIGPVPRGMRRRIMDAQVERLLPIGELVQKLQRMLRNEIGHVSVHDLHFAVLYNVGPHIGTAAAGDREPACEAFLRNGAIAEMPFAA